MTDALVITYTNILQDAADSLEELRALLADGKSYGLGDMDEALCDDIRGYCLDLTSQVRCQLEAWSERESEAAAERRGYRDANAEHRHLKHELV